MSTTGRAASAENATADREIVVSRVVDAPRERVFEAFTEPDGAATRIEMRTVFPTRELRDRAVQQHGAVERGRQTLGDLAAYVVELVEERPEG